MKRYKRHKKYYWIAMADLWPFSFQTNICLLVFVEPKKEKKSLCEFIHFEFSKELVNKWFFVQSKNQILSLDENEFSVENYSGRKNTTRYELFSYKKFAQWIQVVNISSKFFRNRISNILIVFMVCQWHSFNVLQLSETAIRYIVMKTPPFWWITTKRICDDRLWIFFFGCPYIFGLISLNIIFKYFHSLWWWFLNVKINKLHDFPKSYSFSFNYFACRFFLYFVCLFFFIGIFFCHSHLFVLKF